MKNKILIIVPAYNEEESILEVIKETRNYFPEGDILVIDDGSKDRTKEMVKDKVNFLITLPFHLGLGVALQTGYIFAKKHSYDFVVHFDADGQHIAEEIPKLLKPLRSGECDLSLGSRCLDNNYKFSFLRRFLSRSISRVLSLYLKEPIKDPTSGFRAMNKKVISLFTQFYPYDYPEIEELLLLTKNGLKIKEVPIRMRLRLKGRSSINFRNFIFYMFKVFIVLLLDLFWLMKLNKLKYENTFNSTSAIRKP
ncbi:MAG: glycosyltransferase family 2 protein [Candidatus Omnitrophica bacterium]|nr:glycosyltransferase family 2 protein [Candidatus Omnitrophota bacterium]MCM8793081.1 glycosyltransferase family 2 protein [Candidatus Omnitrophota bacterium]